jgi:hypothetical protein
MTREQIMGRLLKGDYREVLDLITSQQKQIEVLREALKLWQRYFQKDIPRTSDQQEQEGEEFTTAWFETEKALALCDDRENSTTRIADSGKGIRTE